MKLEIEKTSPKWTIWFKNGRVEKGWAELCEKAPENMKRCEERLETKPMERVSGRVFPLIGKRYAGAWEYEVTGSDRVFYIPDPTAKTVSGVLRRETHKASAFPGVAARDLDRWTGEF